MQEISGESNKNERKQKNTSKVSIKSTSVIISVVLIIAILALVVGTVMLSINTTNETEEAGMQAMAKKGDYIKEIQKVETSNEYMDIYIDENGEKVPIPKGYVGSSVDGENTVKEGYVIYEKTEEEIKSNADVKITEANKWNEMNTRNQYVWVPVPNVSEMYGIDENGKMWGKLYYFSESNNNKTGTAPNNWSENGGIMKLNSSTNCREPDIVKASDIPIYFRQCGARAESALEHLMNLELEFETSIESIAKYGGFYIGRYETGGLNAEAKVVRMDININDQTWYSMYEKCKMLNGANENVVTSMIFGSQFDRALMWIIESENNIDIADVATDSKDWGNYSNVKLTYDKDGNGEAERTKDGGMRIPAGSSEKTKANNIYDLCGNVYDWTIEADSTSYRVSRGGDCLDSSTDTPARGRLSEFLYDSSFNCGCRCALFIR